MTELHVAASAAAPQWPVYFEAWTDRNGVAHRRPAGQSTSHLDTVRTLIVASSVVNPVRARRIHCPEGIAVIRHEHREPDPDAVIAPPLAPTVLDGVTVVGLADDPPTPRAAGLDGWGPLEPWVDQGLVDLWAIIRPIDDAGEAHLVWIGNMIQSPSMLGFVRFDSQQRRPGDGYAMVTQANPSPPTTLALWHALRGRHAVRLTIGGDL